MLMKCLALVCLLAATCVSGENKVGNSSVLQQHKATESNANMEMNGTKTEAMKTMQVTGFITANGSIYEVEDKNGMGQIEARQNAEQQQQQLLTPQPGEFICNYGSVVLYSDRPCENKKNQTDMANMDDMAKPLKTTKSEHKDKETSASVSASAVDVQSDDNSDGVAEHKENNNKANNVANGNKKKRRGNNKNKNKRNKNKNKKQNKIRRNPNNKGYVIKRTRYRVKRPQGPQQQQQQSAAVVPQLQQQQQQQLQQQALRQGVRRPQNQNQRRQEQATNMKRRRQQQLRRLLQQRRRAQQQNAVAAAQKQRFATPDGLVYEIIDVNEN